MEYERRDYFRNRFTVDELRSVLTSAGVDARDVLSTRSKAYRTRPDDIDALTDTELIAAMVDEPTLIRRPLVVADGTVVTGFDKSGLQAIATAKTGSE